MLARDPDSGTFVPSVFLASLETSEKKKAPKRVFFFSSSATRARTWDPSVNSGLLYQLSYRGMLLRDNLLYSYNFVLYTYQNSYRGIYVHEGKGGIACEEHFAGREDDRE